MPVERRGALATEEAPRTINLAQSIAWARRQHGKGAFRQFREIRRLMRPPHLFTPTEYFWFGFFRQGFGPERFATYVSARGSHALNDRLSPEDALSRHPDLADKLATADLLARAGLPIAPVRALVGASGPLAERTLSDADALAAFLVDPANLPLFGKPRSGSGGLGAVAIDAVGADGHTLILGDGGEVPASALAAQILQHYGEGYIFQPRLVPHPDAARLIGPAIGTLRIATLRQSSGIETLYIALRMPPAGAITDGLTNRRPNAIALVEAGTGRILRARDLARFPPGLLAESLATGAPLEGAVLPDVASATALAERAHALFAGHGLLGFDFALTVDGPVINEINARPYHSIYQHAADSGVLNDEFRPKIEAAIAESARMRG